MKLFITFSPRQEEGKLHLSKYKPQGNQRLLYDEGTRFPIVPVINGYTEPGETIRVIAVCPDFKCCRRNLGYLKEELEALFARKGLVSAAADGAPFELIVVPDDDRVSSYVDTFQKLIDAIRDGDDIHACITYGNKPAPMAELMALRYARQLKKDAYVSCVVYGKYGWGGNDSEIYDETALVHLDDIIRVLAQTGNPNPGETLKQIIGM